MLSALSSSLIFVLLLANCGIAFSSCTFTAGDGSHYDLSAISAEYSIAANDYNYKVMVCKTLPTTCYGMSQSVCRISIWGGVEYACGTSASMTFRDYPQAGGGVSIFYDGGEACGGTPRTSTVNVICDLTTDGNLVSATEATGCDLVFNLRSKHACPTAGGGHKGGAGTVDGLSGGSILLIIIAVGAVVYLGAGFFYRTKVQSAEGLDRIPNLEFWQGLPGLVMDGFIYTKNKILDLTHRGNL